MDQNKIGQLICQCRKKKNLTQLQLAEMLGISDRAVSKWERGINLPDVSLMIELSHILDISLNELLSGEIIEEKNYINKMQDLLLDMAKQEEQLNKKMMMYEWIIGIISSTTFLVLMFVLSYAVDNNVIKVLLFIFAFIVLIVGVSFALKIETETGYYECQKCHHQYVPKYKQVYFAMHFGTTRYMKCPSCGKRSWQKKILKKS